MPRSEDNRSGRYTWMTGYAAGCSVTCTALLPLIAFEVPWSVNVWLAPALILLTVLIGFAYATR